MATRANSTSTPERLLLRDVAAPGRLLPTSLPCALSPHAEFLLLMDIKRQTEARLDELVEIIDPGVPHLPLSQIRSVGCGGVLAFKGGQHGSR